MRFLASVLFILLIVPVSAQINSDVRRNVVSRGGVGAAGNTFMQVIDANGRKVIGNSQAKERRDYIAISAFSQKSYFPEDEITGQLGEKAIHGKVKVTKMADESTAVLLEMLDTRQKLDRVEIVIFGKDEDGDETEQYRLRLEGVTIVSVHSQLTGQNPRLGGATAVKEDITLQYDRISWAVDNGTSSYHTNID